MHKIDTQSTSKRTKNHIRKAWPPARGPPMYVPVCTPSRISCIYLFQNLNFIVLIRITIFRLVIRRELKERILPLTPSSNLCKCYHCLSPYSGHWGHKNGSRVEHSDLQPWLPFRMNLAAFNICQFSGPHPLLSS